MRKRTWTVDRGKVKPLDPSILPTSVAPPQDVIDITPRLTAGSDSEKPLTQRQREAKILAISKMSPSEVREHIAKVMAERNYDPIIELIEIAKAVDDTGKRTTNIGLRKEIALELMQFQVPKLKATDVTVQGNMNIQVAVVQFSPPKVGDSEKRVLPS